MMVSGMKHLLEKDSNYSANPLPLSVLSKEKKSRRKGKSVPFQTNIHRERIITILAKRTFDITMKVLF